MIHALRDYARAQEVLMYGGFDDRPLKPDWCTGINWLESVMRLVEGKDFKCLVMLLWNIWNSRNNFIFRVHDKDSKLIWERAKTFCKDFRIYNLTNVAMILKPVKQRKWSKPPIGTIKINVDVA